MKRIAVVLLVISAIAAAALMGPGSLGRGAAQTPTAMIKVQKAVGDTFNAPGWTFTPTVTGGTSLPASGITDGLGQVSFTISIDAATATVSLAETLGSPPIFSAVCSFATIGGSLDGSFDGIDSVDGIVVSPGDTVSCYFQNGFPGPPTPTRTPTPTLSPSPTPTPPPTPSPTAAGATATPPPGPPAVGGIVGLIDDGSRPASAGEGSSHDGLLPALIAAGLLLTVAGVWIARRHDLH